ncbi:glycosyltransferase [Neobacillus sp. PS3-40]|uniref:MGDG synthase family glycosyltransferase n=1 Tax=Neobacillus sp. PS3-40 TaxID=3070679 RepID=UPI0027DFCF4C|nr:glycosyltransferase [Neobacillus sp. PS3-40]WML43469.1 glycosyltransferase [Neobacillus sp. PS3-40]
MVMNSEGKILILSGRFGEGHQQVANAIKEATALEFPSVETIVLDFFVWAYPNLFPISHYVYMKGIKTFPQVYGYLYQKTYEGNPLTEKLNSFFSMGIGKMLSLLQTEKPSVVVSTFPFASSIISKLKEYGLTNIPLVTVITDHTHHSYWLHPCTDQYIVGSIDTQENLIQLGIPSEKIACTGIPIRTRFLGNRNRKDLYRKYQLEPNISTVLIMGGGEGLIGKGLLNSKELEVFPIQLQLIILCGHNEKLRQHLQNELISSKHLIHILGYTDDVDELMAVSEIIVTKPGGVTTSEALAMELPMLLYKPLPGQEQDNAQYLIDSGAAIQANSPSDLFDHLLNLLNKRSLLEKMKENARNIQTKKAAFFALGVINQSMVNNALFSKEFITTTKFKSYRHIKKSMLVSQGR